LTLLLVLLIFFDAVARISHLGIYYGINDNERVSSVKQFLEGGE
jgi:hypothetical protein